MSSTAEDRQSLFANLALAAQVRGETRLRRLMKMPATILWSKLVSIAHIRCGVKARTFWGEQMRVMLPEVVSKEIWQYRFFEEDTCLYMLHHLREGMTCIDVGAHFGFFSLLAAHLVGDTGEVLALEPMPRTWQLLKENTIQYPSIRVCRCAAFDTDGDITFHDYGLEKAAFNSAFGIRERTSGKTHKDKDITVSARKIDTIVQEKECKTVDVVKIDAESSESQVLDGMQRVIERHMPRIILEVGDFGIPGVRPSRETVTWLEKRGYLPYEIRARECVRHTKKRCYEYMNLLFVPRAS